MRALNRSSAVTPLPGKQLRGSVTLRGNGGEMRPTTDVGVGCFPGTTLKRERREGE